MIVLGSPSCTWLSSPVERPVGGFQLGDPESGSMPSGNGTMIGAHRCAAQRAGVRSTDGDRASPRPEWNSARRARRRGADPQPNAGRGGIPHSEQFRSWSPVSSSALGVTVAPERCVTGFQTPSRLVRTRVSRGVHRPGRSGPCRERHPRRQAWPTDQHPPKVVTSGPTSRSDNHAST